MGIGETCEIFQSEGITAVHREELKIRESGTDTEEAVLISILAVILSGPEEVSGDSLDKIQDICSEVQRRSEEHEKGGAEGGVLDKGGVSLMEDQKMLAR